MRIWARQGFGPLANLRPMSLPTQSLSFPSESGNKFFVPLALAIIVSTRFGASDTPVIFAFLAKKVESIAVDVRAVHVACTRLTTFLALAYRFSNGDGEPVVEHEAVAIESFALHHRVFCIGDNPAMQLVDVLKPFVFEEGRQFLAPNSSGAVRQDRALFVVGKIVS